MPKLSRAFHMVHTPPLNGKLLKPTVERCHSLMHTTNRALNGICKHPTLVVLHRYRACTVQSHIAKLGLRNAHCPVHVLLALQGLLALPSCPLWHGVTHSTAKPYPCTTAGSVSPKREGCPPMSVHILGSNRTDVTFKVLRAASLAESLDGILTLHERTHAGESRISLEVRLLWTAFLAEGHLGQAF